jgi:hypothetical protein
MPQRARFRRLSAAFGLLWGGFATALSLPATSAAWGGLIASPFIGLLVGLGLWRTRAWAVPLRALVALVALYAAAALFGLGVGMADWLMVDAPGRRPGAVVLQSVFAFPWGLTVTGYVLPITPAAWLSTWAIDRLAR